MVRIAKGSIRMGWRMVLTAALLPLGAWLENPASPTAAAWDIAAIHDPLDAAPGSFTLDGAGVAAGAGANAVVLRVAQREAGGSDRGAADAAKPVPQGALARDIFFRREQFRAVEPFRIEQARQRVKQSLLSLDAFLRTSTEAKRQAWRKYLKWETLEEELYGEGTPSLVKLVGSYNQFASGEKGTRLDRFANVRDSLRQYIELLQLTESEDGRVAAEQERLVRVMQDFENYLKGGGEAKEAGWKRFLRWDDLLAEIRNEEPRSPVIRRMLSRWEGKEEGLRRPAFRRVARALAKWEELRQLAQRPKARDLFAARMDQLSSALERYRDSRSNSDAATIVTAVNWLQNTGLHDDLALRTRNLFGRPNVYVNVSARLVEREMQDRACQSQPVGRWFEGSWVTGTATTNSCITGRLLPSSNGALLEVRVDGHTVAHTVAQKRRVYVSTLGHTGLLGIKRLHLTEAGLFDYPAYAWAGTVQQTQGICVDRRIGRRLIARGARRRATESRYRAQGVASQDAISQLSTRMDSQGAETVQKSNAQIEELKARLRQQKLYPERVAISSSSAFLFLEAVSRDMRSLATAEPPPLCPTQGDIGLRLHQSAVNNVLVRLFGGVKLTSENVAELLEQYGLEVPEELRGKTTTSNGEKGAGSEEEGEEPEFWAITFDNELPASVAFTDNLARVSVRGRKFLREDQEINERIEISADYRLMRTTDGYLVAERTGDVIVDFVDAPQRLSTRQLSYKVFIERKFSALFKDRITTYELPERGNLARLRDLSLDGIETVKGWLSTSLSMRPGVSLKGSS